MTSFMWSKSGRRCVPSASSTSAASFSKPNLPNAPSDCWVSDGRSICWIDLVRPMLRVIAQGSLSSLLRGSAVLTCQCKSFSTLALYVKVLAGGMAGRSQLASLYSELRQTPQNADAPSCHLLPPQQPADWEWATAPAQRLGRNPSSTPSVRACPHYAAAPPSESHHSYTVHIHSPHPLGPALGGTLAQVRHTA